MPTYLPIEQSKINPCLQLETQPQPSGSRKPEHGRRTGGSTGQQARRSGPDIAAVATVTDCERKRHGDMGGSDIQAGPQPPAELSPAMSPSAANQPEPQLQRQTARAAHPGTSRWAVRAAGRPSQAAQPQSGHQWARQGWSAATGGPRAGSAVAATWGTGGRPPMPRHPGNRARVGRDVVESGAGRIGRAGVNSSASTGMEYRPGPARGRASTEGNGAGAARGRHQPGRGQGGQGGQGEQGTQVSGVRESVLASRVGKSGRAGSG